MCGEFDLIARYFDRYHYCQPNVALGIGDDCALVTIPEQQLVAVSTDTLVAGIHFLADIAPADLGHKCLAVNLSDLAAMGAKPAWLSLALTLPEVDANWLQLFSDSLFTQINAYKMQLIGGDITRGPLSITITVHGLIPAGMALLRRGAKIGDAIYVTGTLGDSAAGLALLQNRWHIDGYANGNTMPYNNLCEKSNSATSSGKTSSSKTSSSKTSSSQKNSGVAAKNFLLERHLRPQPRLLTGIALRKLASAAIDISDGLVADLRHILTASQCGADLHLDMLPYSLPLARYALPEQAREWALNGGEDYELCFTVRDKNRGALAAALSHTGVQYSYIGQIQPPENGLRFFQKNKPIHYIPRRGFDHFLLPNHK